MDVDPDTTIRSQSKKQIKDRIEHDVECSRGEPLRMVREREVNLEKLKKFALENLSKKSPLRDILLSEANMLGASDFLAKMDLWLKLFSSEARA